MTKKLTPQDKAEIASIYKSGDMTTQAIAREFKISEKTVQRIAKEFGFIRTLAESNRLMASIKNYHPFSEESKQKIKDGWYEAHIGIYDWGPRPCVSEKSNQEIRSKKRVSAVKLVMLPKEIIDILEQNNIITFEDMLIMTSDEVYDLCDASVDEKKQIIALINYLSCLDVDTKQLVRNKFR